MVDKNRSKILKYSALRYSPTRESGENINLGILIEDTESGRRAFYFSTDFDRVKNFDKKISIRGVKSLLKGIKDEVEVYWNEDNYNFDSFTRYYINSYHFDKPKEMVYDDFDSAAKRLENRYGIRFYS